MPESADLRTLTKYLCHKHPERTFQIRGMYFPVCSRCTGLWIGIVLGYFISIMFLVEYSIISLMISTSIIIPCFIDGFTQFLGVRQSNNPLRFFTGLAAGTGAAIVISFI